MIYECFEKATAASASNDSPVATLELDYLQRSRSRGRAIDSDGDDIAWFLDRGGVIADEDVLVSQQGKRIKIRAAQEEVSEVHSSPEALIHAAYHLGNRHLPLQIGHGWLRYQKDHVIDEMIRSFGLKIEHADAPFDPEAGAYHGGHRHD
jgi:urease accessory protein